MAKQISYPSQGFMVGDAEMQAFLRRGQHLRAVAVQAALWRSLRWLATAARRITRRIAGLQAVALWRAPGSGRCMNC